MQRQGIVQADRLTEQLKQFREDDEARWSYVQKELQRQYRIRKAAGGSDDDFKARLKKTGINVTALESQWKRGLEKQQRVITELSKIEPPPRRRGLKTRFVLDQLVGLPEAIDTIIYPPASSAWGNTEECGTNLGLAEWNLKRDETGDGWGWQATASSGPQECTLFFVYFPPRAGELTVEPHIDVQGEVVISANDHWYTSTHADLELKLHFDLFQHYWDGEQIATILDEHHQDVEKTFWVDDNRVMTKTLSVSARDPVWIKLTCALDVSAHSNSAHVACDFRTGSDRRIRVEYIRIHMPGSRPVVLES